MVRGIRLCATALAIAFFTAAPAVADWSVQYGPDHPRPVNTSPTQTRPGYVDLHIWDVQGWPTLSGDFLVCWAVAGDFNGDGSDDRASFCDGLWTISPLTGGSTSVWFGGPGDEPVPADYDGNGVDEVGVFRPSNGTWYWPSAPTGYRFGGPADTPVPGDYNGDGGDEPAIYRTSNGHWYVPTSPGGTAFGVPCTNTYETQTQCDVPVPADFDGDGGDNLAVYRRGTGWWYTQVNPTGFPFGEPCELRPADCDRPLPGQWLGTGRRATAGIWRRSNAVWYFRST